MSGNYLTLLKTFIGEDKTRKERFISYCDRLVGFKIGIYSVTLSDQEKKMLEGKKLEKYISKFLRENEISETLTPNTLTVRCRDCLLYHHYQWRKNDTSFTNFEENAMVFFLI